MVDPTDDKDKFEFEIENDAESAASADQTQTKKQEKEDIDVVDDTPEEDKGRTPLPADLVAELEKDELDEYSEKVKTRLKQMKKVWHDERREKERSLRELNEATTLAQRVIQENQRLKSTLSEGEKALIQSLTQTNTAEAEQAKNEYRKAHEEGDADGILKANEKLATATYRLEQLKNYQPQTNTRQEQNKPIEYQQEVDIPRPDPKTLAWQERNTWWGTDEEMTATALGLHSKLQKQHGNGFVGTDEYWNSIDATMRRRFPESFGTETANSGTTTASRAATVVAPASRSTSSKKIVLKQSQVALAKRLGLTPEQYAREFAKLEKNNG